MYVSNISLTTKPASNVYTQRLARHRSKYLKAERSEAQSMSVLLEKILDRNNMNLAYKKVYTNKGAGGVDGVTLDELKDYIKENWTRIAQEIRGRKYKPLPVRRVEIPKPNGGVRQLGIPTVMDRVIQQAIVQVISPIAEPYFSESSYGFRPKRSCEKAILKVLDYLNDGYEWMVDIDLEKFFDKVSQDKLMSYTHDIVQDRDVESLITRYLKAGVMSKGKYEKTSIGTPQGGNLSPLLSNIMLNKLDKELESRGLRLARYADDALILVKSEASAKRVMQSITKWIEKKLGLTVNMTKTKVSKPNKTKFLGFGFYKDHKDGVWKCRPHEDSVAKFKAKLKELTSRKWSISLKERIKKINQVTRGWINYFVISNMKKVIGQIDAHLRTRMRVVIWKQWKTPRKRQWGLQKLGIHKDLARQTSYMGRRYQFIVLKTCVVRAISKQKLAQKGLVSCLDYYLHRQNLKFK